ncbi:hypothetical protein CTEN210_14323 [Chaetoceros tenuissimus]|uniref:Circumsporozoite protein n=1 Tax=Chaetoceros tenuissimus TaxID=426638 RepID=A0AAD3D5I2_9STRA|nr:hypothetical protein CTEN210_14323 [Chaetoceros tenuissimus]
MILKPSHEGGALHRGFLAVLLLASYVQATHSSTNKNTLDGTLSHPASSPYDEAEKKSSSDTLFSTRFSSIMDETGPNMLDTDKTSTLVEKDTSPEDLFLDELAHPPFLKEKGSSIDDSDVSGSALSRRVSVVSTDSSSELPDSTMSTSGNKEVSDDTSFSTTDKDSILSGLPDDDKSATILNKEVVDRNKNDLHVSGTKSRRDSIAADSSTINSGDERSTALESTSNEEITRQMQMQLSSFRIMTSYFGESRPTYCLKAQSMSAGSKLVMRPCNGDLRNYFHFDRSGYLRLSAKPELCLRWNDTQLEMNNCVNGIDKAYFAMGVRRIRAVGFGNDPSQQWLVGLRPKSPYEKVRLYKASAHSDNKSLFLWFKDYASEAPSITPTSMPSVAPTSSPSVQPSSSPSAKPSPSPSAKPSPSPTSIPSSEPSDQPSLLPSSEPSMGPSRDPSSEPSLLPSSEPSDQPSLLPSDEPSMEPSRDPSSEPSLLPSSEPSSFPTECEDEEGWRVAGESDYAGMNCTQVASEEQWCDAIWALNDHAFNGKGVKEACCACQGSRFTSTYPSTAPSTKPSISMRPSVISENPSAAPSSQPSDCIDEPNWYFNEDKALGCKAISEEPDKFCEQFSSIWYKDKNTYLACCDCGGGLHQSVAPSVIPTSSPSVLPSNVPSLSFEPTRDITLNPSEQPSVSMEPSNFPSVDANSLFDGDECNYDSECRVGRECIDKICGLSSLSSSNRRERTLEIEGGNEDSSVDNYDKRELNVNSFVLDVTDYTNQDNKPVNYHTFATFVRGGLAMNADDTEKFTLIGNAWKAYPLIQPYYISKNTRLKFELSIEEQTQGHAICVDSDAILSDSRKCIWLSGDEFERHDVFDTKSPDYDLRRAKIANLALGMPSTQSSTSHFGISDARKAVDGYINPRWSDSVDLEKNSISVTNQEKNAWWQVNLLSLKTISEVVIHEWKVNPLGAFQLKIMNGSSINTIGPFDKDHESFSNNVYRIPFESAAQGDKVRIELVEEGILALVEVLVLGEEPSSTVTMYDIAIGEMIKDGVSFGHPIWDGVRVDLNQDDVDYTLPGSTNSHVRLRASHIFTDVLASVSQSSCKIVIHKDASRNIFSLDVTPSTGFFHVELPPGIAGSEVEFQGCSPTEVQIFGGADPVQAGSAFDGSRPLIKYIALIQNSQTVEDSITLVGKSIFKSVELYDAADDSSEETSKYLPFKVGENHTLSAVSYGNFGAFDQDFAGEVHVSTDHNRATLKGNAWKAFRLSTPFPVTEETRLKFHFELKNEAEGHAICVENDLVEDPFAGKNVRCVLIGGSQYNEWSHVKRDNLALRATATQSRDVPGDTRGLASNAVDGNMNTFTNTGSIPNNPKTDFFVEIKAGFTITEVKIYNRMDSFADRFKKFKVYVKTMSGAELYSVDLDKSSVDASGLVYVKDIELNEEEIPANEKLKVGIELNNDGSSTGYPHMIGEFQVFGKPVHDRVTSFDIHVADLFPETNSMINYIALIQDNDENPYLGESVYSEVQLVNQARDLNATRPLQAGVDNNPASPRSHVNFGSLVVPDPLDPWTAAKSKFPTREDGWDILRDELEDPKDYCYFTEVQTSGYNSNNPKKTNLNDFWKNEGIVTPNRVKAEGGRNDCREGKVSFGPSFEFQPLKCDLTTVSPRKESEKLRRCQGHCESDDDCEEGLSCFRNQVVDNGKVQHQTQGVPADCQGTVTIPGTNYCVKQLPKLQYLGWGNGKKECTGDCTDDSNCDYGLKCFNRGHRDPGPPTCSGVLIGEVDYCYDPHYPYNDICINGVTFEDPNTKFPDFLKDNGFASVYGELVGKSTGFFNCTTKEEKAHFQVHLCDENSRDTYFDHSSDTWYFPSLWPTPQEFKDLLRKKFKELFPAPIDDTDLEDAVNNVYNEVNYEAQYDNFMGELYESKREMFSGFFSGKERYTCPQRQTQEIKENKTYDCFSKGTDPQLDFSYNSPFMDDYNEFLNSLPKTVRDQNSFGFVLTGEIGNGANFPKYLMPGEDTKVHLQKNCYEATITFESSYFHTDESLPIVSGIGALPESCKKTLRCSIHWCGNDPTFTLEAQSEKAFKFKVESHQKGVGSGVVPFTFEGSNPKAQNGLSPNYCLQQTLTVANCKKSITWIAPALDSPKSAHTNRISMVLHQNADATVTNKCFKFPFEWNFSNWQEKRDNGGHHAVTEFFKSTFKPPIEITEHSTVSLVDIAHDVGGGLAVYKDLQTNRFIAQVCNPEVNFHDDTDPNMNFYMNINGAGQSSQPKAIGISDSGTVAVINNGGHTFFVYVFDQVQAKWIQTTTITRSCSTCRIALSTHGHFFAILTDSKVYLYQKALHGSNYESRTFDNSVSLPVDAKYNHVSIYASESGVVSLQLRDESELSSANRPTRELHFVCADTNSIFREGGCICKDGFVLKNKDGVLKKYLTADIEDVCIPEIHSDMVKVTTFSATFPLDTNATYNHNNFETSPAEGEEIVTRGIKLEMRGADGSFSILPINEAYRARIERANGSTANDAKVDLELLGLQPGKLYILTIQYHDGSMQVRFVTKCTCDDSSDSTGMPTNFSIKNQDDGRVMFEFNDNSWCENIFTLVRYSAYEEFSQSIGNIVNIASYKVGSDSSCEEAKISPLEKAMDDQRISKLIVGYTYIYCVQASSDSGSYMPSPYDTRVGSLDLPHSEPNCQPHVIRWEASIDGIVTTEPHAGSLPVDNVEITYQLLSLQLEDLNCNGCSGTVITTVGGGFKIEFNVEHPYLKGMTYKDEIPIRINYTKTTQGLKPIPHRFLCNNGEDDCDNRPFYLKHLEFGKGLHIYDATQVLFTGNVYIDGTEYPGARGCGIKGADIRLQHLTTSGLEEELVRVQTDATGYYEANVVIGTTVTSVNISYHGHDFKKADHNTINYREGLLINTDRVFNNNDFVDETRAELVIEVAGGLCNLPVGDSRATINVMGCPWKYELDWQDTFSKTFTDVPAAVLEVQITDVRESTPNQDPLENDEIGIVKEAFATITRSIDLLDTGAMSDELSSLEAEEETRTGDTGVVANPENSPFDSSEVEGLEKVRFQYDGQLKMDVQIPTSKTCDADPEGSFDSFHVMDYMTVFNLTIGLHHDILGQRCDIVDDGYRVQVISNLGMEEGNKGFGTFFWNSNSETRRALAHCSNIAPPGVPDSKKDNAGVKEDLDYFKSASNTICILDVTHTALDDNGSVTEESKAQITQYLATGRPNPFGTYNKKLLISVIGGTEEVKHEASVFIEGLYSKGEGNTISLPTHEPIMILRDPPGGASTASYENVVTTAKVVSSTVRVHGTSELKTTLSVGADADAKICTGGGVGAIVLGCGGITKTISKASVPFGGAIDTDFKNEERESSHTFSTTWSYETSDEPARAGPDSDVFVVPNLSIKYEEVYNVRWDDIKCDFGLQNFTDPNGDVKVGFPISVVFDVKSTKDSALSFYTRYHLNTVALPNLAKTIGNQENLLERVKANEKICCAVDRYGSCLHEGKDKSTKVCGPNDIEYEQDKLDMLKASRDGWQAALDKEKKTKDNAISGKQDISKWFSSTKELESVVEKERDRKDLKISDHKAYLVPDTLISSAKSLEGTKEVVEDANDKKSISDNGSIRKAKRVHIVGDGGTYEMSLSREATHAYTRQNCDVILPLGIAGGLAGGALLLTGGSLPIALPVFAGTATVGAAIAGCNNEYEFSSGGGFEAEGVIFTVAAGAETAFDYGIQVSHTSAITDESSEETTVSFVLADPDDGDELVIDIYHEPVYGSFVFDLKAGITKCVWEGEPTLMGEDPKLTVTTAPSQFVFPTDEMIFDLETLNIGEYVYSYFYLVQDTSLEVKLDDGGLLDSYGSNLQLYKEQPVQRFVRIFKPQNGYEFDPVKLTLKSVCESDMDNNKRTVSVLLSNSADVNGNPKLKWLEPCPRVEWAGDLRRDRTFLVNTLSNDSSKIKVKVFNPSASKEKKSFNDMTKSSGRLEHVNLLYRKVGEANWKNAQNKDVQSIDFALGSMSEDPFGYVSEFWNIGNLADGNYELTVEARCSSTGGPEDFDYYRESSIVGVIDNSRPEQFGKVLPLRDDIMFGEEMTIIFTEPIDCSFPFKFDVNMTVDDDWRNPYLKDKFHIICDGRQIRLQIDHTNTNPEIILGKSFKLEVGRVSGGSDQSGIFDVHGNKRYRDALAGPAPIIVERKFADINLKRALTKFTVSKQGEEVNCSQMDSSSEQVRDELRSELAAFSNSGNKERFVISEISCDDRQSKIDAKIEILAQEDSGRRGLLKANSKNVKEGMETSTRILAVLQKSLKKEMEQGGRRLAVGSTLTLSNVHIIPGAHDVEKFSGTEEQKEEERQLLEYATSGLMESQSGLGEIMNELRREKEAERKEHEAEINVLTQQMQMEQEEIRAELRREKEKERKEHEAEINVLTQQMQMEQEEIRSLTEHILGGGKIQNAFVMQGLVLVLGCAVAGFSVYLFIK